MCVIGGCMMDGTWRSFLSDRGSTDAFLRRLQVGLCRDLESSVRQQPLLGTFEGGSGHIEFLRMGGGISGCVTMCTWPLT